MTNPTSQAEATQSVVEDIAAGQPVSLKRLLGESARLYAQHGRTFTAVLCRPLLKMLLGVYGCLIVTHGFTSAATEALPALTRPDYLPWFLLALSLLTIGTLIPFFQGCWEYLVYTASLNINAWEAANAHPTDFQAAYQGIAKEKASAYKQLLTAYCVLPLLALSPMAVGLCLSMLANDGMTQFGMIALSSLMTVLLLGLWLVATLFLTFLFQQVAFEPADRLSIIHTFGSSTKYVLKRFWATLGLQVLLLLLTNAILTTPILWLARTIRLTQPLDAAHLWLLSLLLKGVDFSPVTQNALFSAGVSEGAPLFPELLQNPMPYLASQITDSVILLCLTSLLLPLGTFAFTLLYKNVLSQNGTLYQKHAVISEQTPEAPQNAPATQAES